MSMTKAIFAVSDFIRELTTIRENKSYAGLLLNIDEGKTWPHFSISCDHANTPLVTGYFVESGTSYWQISDSGREVFTGSGTSSLQFINEIRAVLHVLNTAGCTETRWSNQGGQLIGSSITIATLPKELLFGERPSFWRINLVKQQIRFAPYDSCPK